HHSPTSIHHTSPPPLHAPLPIPPKPTNKPNAPLAAVTAGTRLLRKCAPGSMGCALRIVQKWLKFSITAPAFLPTKIPKKINPRRDRKSTRLNSSHVEN